MKTALTEQEDLGPKKQYQVPFCKRTVNNGSAASRLQLSETKPLGGRQCLPLMSESPGMATVPFTPTGKGSGASSSPEGPWKAAVIGFNVSLSLPFFNLPQKEKQRVGAVA